MDTEFLDIKDIRLHIGKLLLLLTANVRIEEKQLLHTIAQPNSKVNKFQMKIHY